MKMRIKIIILFFGLSGQLLAQQTTDKGVLGDGKVYQINGQGITFQPDVIDGRPAQSNGQEAVTNVGTKQKAEGFNPLIVMLFFVVWISSAMYQYLFFNKQTVVFKRKYFPRIVVIGSFVFIVFLLALFQWHLQMLVVFIPAVGLIAYGNIKITKFCDKCGKQVQNANWGSKMDYCPKCGAKLGS
jgi:hypothetical protein